MCKTEGIRGLHVKDYRELDIQALEEIICLNEQLKTNLEQIRLAVNDGVNHQALYLLDILLEDNDSHTDYCKQCQEEILADMECTEASNHFKDYMNPPIEEDEITICQQMHETRKSDCNKCTEPCCPMSDVNMK